MQAIKNAGRGWAFAAAGGLIYLERPMQSAAAEQVHSWGQSRFNVAAAVGKQANLPKAPTMLVMQFGHFPFCWPVLAINLNLS